MGVYQVRAREGAHAWLGSPAMVSESFTLLPAGRRRP
ncbi:hypothetical protein J2X48_002564 [Bosea sp. BE271]|nr:hypothetical protein [Bosea robiniae]MDR6895535.1 hypothetical protein [Bosea sp. BE109]MDR7138931.1 hypothetical protein [Bosea sp. BE168]MDR7175632.1 hypothetical protein [Bosea sp. BE271]